VNLEVGLDWLAFTLKSSTMRDLEKVLGSCVESSFEDAEHGTRFYRSLMVDAYGGRIEHRPYDESRSAEIHVELPAKWCRAASEASLRGLLLWVRRHGRATRIDVAADDYGKRVTPAELYDDARAENRCLVTRARKGSLTAGWGGGAGSTFAVGLRGSARYLRVYDKAAESDGEIDAIRWEWEFRGEASAWASNRLINGNWGRVWADGLVSFVDYRERGARAKVAKCPRVDWFASLVADGERCRMFTAVQVSSASRMERWVNRQVWPTLSALLAVNAGDMDFIYAGLRAGREKWALKHRLAVAAA
jgi:DNA relaxase NicK